MQSAIEAYELSKYYGSTQAIKTLSFQISPGEIVGFLGPNGAGKSTTLRILNGLIPATSGQAFICGQSISQHPQKIKQFIGYMPENNPLPEDLRVQEYLSLRAKLKGITSKMHKARILEALELVDLDKTACRSLIFNLSKGYKQRLGLADALLGQPPVIILDEPTIGLDPHQLIRFRQLLDQLRGRMSVLISSHILSEIEACCDRVIIINHGHLIAAGKPSDLRKEFFPHQRIRIQMHQEPQKARTLLNSIPYITIESITHNTLGGSTAVLISKSSTAIDVSALIAQLNVLKIDIYAFGVVVASLEDIFMMATKRCWDHTQLSASK